MLDLLMAFFGAIRNQSSTRDRKKQCRLHCGFEQLESRTMLAIDWTNRGAVGDDSDDFEEVYGAANAAIARQLVDRAIADWEAVITNFNYAEDSDADPNNNRNSTFVLDLFADETIAGRGLTDLVMYSQHRPISGRVRLDDDSQGQGWFFDMTPLDDAEFTAIVNSGTTGQAQLFTPTSST